MKFASVVVIALSIAAMSCSKKSHEESKPGTFSQLKKTANAMQAMEAMSKAMEAATNNANKGVADFREMKALLPKELSGGLKAEEGYPKGQKSGAMGITVSEAECEYRGDGDANLSIKISDIGGMGGMGVMAHAAWASIDIDNESDDGYEKTTKIGGFKAMEKYNKKDKSGELHVFVDGRFIVELRGNNVTVDQMKGSLNTVDLKKLAALKPVAPTEQ